MQAVGTPVTVNHLLLFKTILVLLLPLANIEGSEKQKPVSGDETQQVILLPYVSASSDVGIEAGIIACVASHPGMIVYYGGYLTTKGHSGLSIRGERDMGNLRLIGESSLTRIKHKLYRPSRSIPRPFASAVVNRFQFNLAVMKETTEELEIGPELFIDVAKGENQRDAQDRPASLVSLSRFGLGSLIQIGPRIRYRTTSTLRPLHGVIIDGSVRIGRAGGDALSHPEADFAINLRLAGTLPISDRKRLYLRGWWGHQHAAPPPVRYSIGGIRTVRGLPLNRNFGRRLINIRSQFHYKLIDEWGVPMSYAHNLWNAIPSMKMNIETVAFYDIGSIGDPDYGWRQLSHGFGGGLRIIFPPEMTFFFDVAKSPGGGLRFYFGAGETL